LGAGSQGQQETHQQDDADVRCAHWQLVPLLIGDQEGADALVIISALINAKDDGQGWIY